MNCLRLFISCKCGESEVNVNPQRKQDKYRERYYIVLQFGFAHYW